VPAQVLLPQEQIQENLKPLHLRAGELLGILKYKIARLNSIYQVDQSLMLLFARNIEIMTAVHAEDPQYSIKATDGVAQDKF